ncbi:MAG TPA: SET domain-containing protein-lysine N-methyltransferase, partial [Betaproteobacteria bacterium]|nr:SET domain-containing protein-lysine N-methyltransferase [Betaproteobacteria bacterium]
KVNHSCDPNCGIKINNTGAHDFVAIRAVAVNEEITFDYAMRNYDIDYFPKQCLCGSAICRGSITGWKDLPDERKKAYGGFVAPYLLELDAKHCFSPA